MAEPSMMAFRNHVSKEVPRVGKTKEEYRPEVLTFEVF